MERKYRQKGYSDAEAREKKRERADRPQNSNSRVPSRTCWGRARRGWWER